MQRIIALALLAAGLGGGETRQDQLAARLGGLVAAGAMPLQQRTHLPVKTHWSGRFRGFLIRDTRRTRTNNKRDQ